MSLINNNAKAVWAYTIHHTLEREGIDSQDIFSAHNFDFSSLKGIQEDIPRALINSLWRSAIEASQNDAFCLKTIEFINEPFINALVSVTRAAGDIRTALSLLEKFHTLISPELQVDVSYDQDIQIKVSNVENLGIWVPEDRDICLAIIAKHGLAIAAREIKPTKLTLTRSRPKNAADYEAFFACPIIFNSEQDSLLYPKRVLDISIPSANSHMQGHFESYLEESLEKQSNSLDLGTLHFKVEKFLLSKIGDNFPNLSECAAHFHMSPSAFKKHLHQENTCYQQLSDQVRENRACKLIRMNELSLKEIAFELGFSNSSAFNKAFKRWTGVVPTQYAKQHYLLESKRKVSTNTWQTQKNKAHEDGESAII